MLLYSAADHGWSREISEKFHRHKCKYCQSNTWIYAIDPPIDQLLLRNENFVADKVI